MAVVLMIVALLLATGMYTLSAQVEQRAREETQRRLEQARETLLGYALANGRLPCPASSTSSGMETLTGAACSNPYDGFLPAVTIGFQPVDGDGFALDAWNNRIRYAVAAQNVTQTPGSCLSAPAQPHFTNRTNLKQNGMSCQPNNSDLIVCKSSVSSPAPNAGNCQGGGTNSVTNQGVLVAVVFSAGKNYALASTAAAATAAGKPDEAENLDGDSVFISHTPNPTGATGGEYDDMMVWISVGQFYGRLATGGVLP
jgi:type II secretory pathway pseudopilin PulG